jgi:hypothetical protein
MKSLILFLAILLSPIAGFAKCSEYYDIAFDRANSFGFNLGDKIDEWSERAGDEGKPGLKAKAFTVAFFAMPYLLIEGGLTDIRRSSLWSSTDVISYANNKLSDSPVWRDFASSIVAGFPSSRSANVHEEEIISEVVSRLDREEKICSIQRNSNGVTRVKIYGIKKIKNLVKKDLKSRGLNRFNL